MKNMKKLAALALTAAMSLSLLTACSGGSAETPAPEKSEAPVESAAPAESTAPAESETPAAPALDKLVMGTSADYPPFEFHILDNGEDKIVGIDVSLGAQIAEDMGAEFEVVHMDFDNLFTLLNQGNCDVVIAAIEIKEERVQSADYSDPYYSDLPPAILVKKGNEDQYKSLEDFSGKVVGAQMATTKADIVTNDMPGAEPQLMSSVVDLMNNLVYDKCDALVLDGAVAEKYLAANEDLAAVPIDMGEAAEPYRVWVAKGDPKGILPAINETIAKVTGDGSVTSWIEEANELSSQALE